MRGFSLAVLVACSAIGLSSAALATDQDETFGVMNNDYASGHRGDRSAITGSVATGSVASDPMQQWKWAACAGRYPSFDPRTGTFVGQDGLRHLCQ